MTHKEFNFNIYKTEFYGQICEAKTTKAVVVLVHGMGEHSGRYKHVAEKLTDSNFSVVAFDHFGHGKTTGKRGHNPNFDAVLWQLTVVYYKQALKASDSELQQKLVDTSLLYYKR